MNFSVETTQLDVVHFVPLSYSYWMPISETVVGKSPCCFGMILWHHWHYAFLLSSGKTRGWIKIALQLNFQVTKCIRLNSMAKFHQLQNGEMQISRECWILIIWKKNWVWLMNSQRFVENRCSGGLKLRYTTVQAGLLF